MARHNRSLRAPRPGWLPRPRRPLGRRELWTTVRAHPSSLWELAIYMILAVVVRVASAEAFGAFDFLTYPIFVLAVCFALGLYMGTLQALHQRDEAAASGREDGTGRLQQ